VLRASIALNRHQPSKAIVLLESAAPYELDTPRSNLQGFFGALYPVYVRGEAYLAANEPKLLANSRRFSIIVES